MQTVLIGGLKIQAKAKRNRYDNQWDGRGSWELTMEMDAEQAKQLFVDDASWTMKREIAGGETVEEVMDDYTVAGPVLDNRDGTVTVKMGMLTDREVMEIVLGVKK